VEATIVLLAERGFRQTTMDAIAARAGVGKSTIYRRWPGKEELIADALRELTAEADVRERPDVHAVLLDHALDVARVLSDPVFGRLLPELLGELQRNPAFAAAYADRIVRPRRATIVHLLERARDAGEIRADADPDEIADLVIGPLLFRRLLPFGLAEPSERYPERIVELVWTAIATG
jgi:AcrR family transcriptional regulator